MRSFKQYLLEIPYIEYGNDKRFDLEFEVLQTADQILQVLRNILSGKFYVDKYGSQIELADKEKKEFAKVLKNDPYIESWFEGENRLEDFNNVIKPFLEV